MLLTKDAYHEWAEQHVNVFGLGDSGDSMVAAWFPIFKGFGYTVAELKAATVALAAAPPQFPNQHLGRVNDAIQSARSETGRRDRLRQLGFAGEPAENDRGSCVLCVNSGWVIVPHPEQIRNGVWQERATAAVVCSCWFGRRLIEANDKRRQTEEKEVKRPMLLAEYERINPRGREQLEEYERAKSKFAREVGPRPGEEPSWARLDDAIDKALGGIASRRGAPAAADLGRREPAANGSAPAVAAEVAAKGGDRG